MAFFRRKKEDEAKKILRVGLVDGIESRDPQRTQEVVSILVATQVFETPYRFDETAQRAVPVLFREPLQAEGPETLSAPIRTDVRFSDGVPMTAEHLAASLMETETFRERATAVAAGDRVRFELREPNPRFDLVLSQSFSALVRRDGDELVGTGPFVFAPAAEGLEVRLVANSHYRDPVSIDEVHFVVYPPDEEGRRTALVAATAAGEVDYTNALSRDDVSQLSTVRKSFQPGSSTTALFFNTTRPHFQSATVRRAVALSIDRSELTKVCYANALAFTAANLLPPMMGTWQDGLRYNPRQAAELLAREPVQWPDRLEMLTVWGPRAYLPLPERVAELLAEQLSPLGMTVEVQAAASAEEYFARLVRADYDLVLGGWIADTPDPADFLESLLSSKLIPGAGKSVSIRANMSHWTDPLTDRLLEQYRHDPSEENKLAVLKRVAEQVPLVPIMYGPAISVTSWRVRNVEPVSVGFPVFGSVELDD